MTLSPQERRGEAAGAAGERGPGGEGFAGRGRLGEHAADRAAANDPFFDTRDCGVSAPRIVEMGVTGLYQKKVLVFTEK